MEQPIRMKVSALVDSVWREKDSYAMVTDERARRLVQAGHAELVAVIPREAAENAKATGPRGRAVDRR